VICRAGACCFWLEAVPGPAQWAYPFNEPVDTKRYDNYLTYVKRPIDFGTIKRKLEAGGYKVPDDMHADIQQARLDSLGSCLISSDSDSGPLKLPLRL
jgi:Bromodomain